MNWKAMAPLIVAVLLGAVALFVAKDAIRRNRTPEAAKRGFAQVAVVKHSIPAGQQLAADDLAMGPIAGEQAPEGTFASAGPLVGRVVISPMVKGQPVMKELLAQEGAIGGLPAMVPPGMRAVTVEINEFSGVGGYLRVGSRVDVITALRDAQNDNAAAMTVVKDVVVQAIGAYSPVPVDGGGANGTSADAASAAARSVTLLVSPEQAETLELATTTGRIRLSLRGNGDRDPVVSTGVTLADMRKNLPRSGGAVAVSTAFDITPVMNTGPSTRPAGDSFIRSREVTVIRGTKAETVTFEQRRPAGLFTDGSN